MLTLALAVLLTFTDPPADLGDGTVRQPTAAVGRPNGALDVTQLELYDSEALTFSLTFTSLANPFNLTNGFTFPVIEVYIDDQSGTGNATLLPGSGMRLPQGATWNYAFKLTGDTLQVFQASANGWQDVTSRYPTNLTVQGTSIVVSSSLPRPEKLDLYGVVGSYTGFNETGWTPMSRTESPWAYSSDTQIPAALDVIAPTFEVQRDALASGVLPVIRPPRPTNPWIFVMIGGVLIAVLGVLLRFAPRNRSLAPYNSSPSYNSTPDFETMPSTPDKQPKRTHPGPYQPEPLKSRSTALKNIALKNKNTAPENTVGNQPVVSEETATPGQLMAAERTKAMILGDRKLRNTGETPVSIVENTEPIRLDNTDFLAQSERPVEITDVEITDVELLADSSATAEVPARKLTPPEKAQTSASAGVASITSSPVAPHIAPVQLTPKAPTVSRSQFAPVEVWQDDEDEFAFLWNDRDDSEDIETLEPDHQSPKTNS